MPRGGPKGDADPELVRLLAYRLGGGSVEFDSGKKQRRNREGREQHRIQQLPDREAVMEVPGLVLESAAPVAEIQLRPVR